MGEELSAVATGAKAADFDVADTGKFELAAHGAWQIKVQIVARAVAPKHVPHCKRAG